MPLLQYHRLYIYVLAEALALRGKHADFDGFLVKTMPISAER